MKKPLLILLAFLGAIATSTSAQQPNNTPSKEAVFHFVNGSSVFIFPGEYNQKLYNEVCDYIDANRELIANGSMPIYVYGYCGTDGTVEERAKRVYQMCNYVKGELINAHKALEKNFITKNSTAPYSPSVANAVVLKFVLTPQATKAGVKTTQSPSAAAPTTPAAPAAPQIEPAKVAEVTPEPRVEEAPTPEIAPTVVLEPTPESDEAATTPEPTPEPAKAPEVAPESTPEPVTATIDTNKENKSAKDADRYSLAVRTNMLHWLLATPNIGVEWRASSVVSLLLDVDWAPWRWNDKRRYYRAWNLQPQVRFYMLPSRRLYVGGEFHTGELNLKLRFRGKQGDFIGGGLVLGYQLRLNKALSIDFNVGAGYTSYEYDKYKDADGFNYPYETGLTKDYWGVTSAGISLVWKIVK